MDTAWIQVFVLTLAECAAPAGKTVCQEREFDLGVEKALEVAPRGIQAERRDGDRDASRGDSRQAADP